MKTEPVNYEAEAHRLLAFAQDRVKREIDAWEGRMRCDLVADQGMGRCTGKVVAVRWEDGFADNVCARHAETAETRGALVIRATSADQAGSA